MKLLILHLSDIHIRGKSDPILQRVTQIVAAVRSLSYQVDLCLVVTTGDQTFSGTSEQYEACTDFFASLRDGLCSELSPSAKATIAAIPGNHDCDFTSAGPARATLAKSVASDPTQPISSDTLLVCTAIQEQFFGFRDHFSDATFSSLGPLYWEHAIEHNGGRILVRCCNTAWMSLLREQPGKLHYPHDLIRDEQKRTDLAITLFHHPYNWLSPSSLRSFRRRVETVSDLVLTGHEHEASLRTNRGSKGEVNLYIEGGALQGDLDARASEFNVILIDTSSRSQKVFQFAWNRTFYERAYPDPAWEDYQANRLRTAAEFELTDSWNEYLHDLGITLTHPSRGTLKLPDVFVYPDLTEVVLPPAPSAPPIPGEQLIALTADSPRLLVTGADKSGKTTLAKRLFLDFRDAGFIPLILDCSTSRLGDEDRNIDSVVRAFETQYASPEVERYRQLHSHRRVLILDNFKAIRLHRTPLLEVLRHLCHFADRVILLSNDLAQEVADLVGSPITDGESGFSQYRIQPFGHVRRNDLIEKWFSTDPVEVGSEAELSRLVVQAKQVMDTVTGKNFVPSYPVMLLPILQALHHNEQLDTSASTYGYFYELLVRAALAKGTNTQSLDVRLGYLSYLAGAMLSAGAGELSERELIEIHLNYERELLIELPFRSFVDELLKTQVLTQMDGKYSFRYPYIYFYFVASYLRDRIGESEVQRKVAECAATLHQEESANILLFLAHLSKDPFIISEMLKAAATPFGDVQKADLRRSTDPTVMTSASSGTSYTDRPTRESRREVFARLDDLEGRRNPGKSNTIAEVRTQTVNDLDGQYAAVTSYVEQMGVAFRTLQILGQLLKNFVGTMDGHLKVTVAGQCIDLGLRTLGSLFKVVEEHGREYLEIVMETLRAQDPTMTDAELEERASETLHGLLTLISYGMVRRVSASIGSPHLSQVYDILYEGDESPAMALIHTSLALDQASRFPEAQTKELATELRQNPTAMQVLRSLVINNFYMFEHRYDLKQRICAALDVKYRPSLGAVERMKLISAGGASTAS